MKCDSNTFHMLPESDACRRSWSFERLKVLNSTKKKLQEKSGLVLIFYVAWSSSVFYADLSLVCPRPLTPVEFGWLANGLLRHSLLAAPAPPRPLPPHVSGWVGMLLTPFAVRVCLLLWVTASYRFTTSPNVCVLLWSIYSELAVTF